MEDKEFDQRLSRISTMWTMLRQAHEGSDRAAKMARQRLMERYCGAVYRYLLAAVRDPHVAEDLSQEFALRFVRGRFKHANPERGRFRDYVKTALFRLVDDYRRGRWRGPHVVPLDGAEPAVAAEIVDSDEAFLTSWREELLARTWKSLEEHQQQSGQPYYMVLQLRVAQPDMPSAQMAEQLTARLGKAYSATAARQLLHRARDKFADLLLKETAQSLGTQAEDQLEQELADLDLLKYCRAALDRRAR